MSLDFLVVTVPQGPTSRGAGLQGGLFTEWESAWPNNIDDTYYDFSRSKVFTALQTLVDVISPSPSYQRTCPGQWASVNVVLIPQRSPDDPQSLLDGNTIFFEETGTRSKSFSFNGRTVNKQCIRTLLEGTGGNSSIHDEYTQLVYTEEKVDDFAEATLESSDRMGTPDCWFGPFVLRVKGDGDAIPAQFDLNGHFSARNVLHRLLDERSVKYVQPIFPWQSDLRWCFLQTLWCLINMQTCCNAKRQLSALERLIFAPRASLPVAPKCYHDSPWHAFFVLDLLGGSWRIGGAGSGNPEFDWIPPSNPSANTRWLANYWYRRWVGEPRNTQLDPFSRPRASFRVVKAPDLSGVEGTTLPIEGELAQNISEESAHDLLKKLPSAPAARSLGATLPLLRKVFTNKALQTPWFNSLFAQRCLGGDRRLRVTELFQFCGEYLMPASPVYAELPVLNAQSYGIANPDKELQAMIDEHNQDVKDVCIDLIRSRGGSVHAVLDDIACSLNQRQLRLLPEELWVTNGEQWLSRWAKTITTHTSDFKLCVRTSKTEFRLDVSRLNADGEERLGPHPLATAVRLSTQRIYT